MYLISNFKLCTFGKVKDTSFTCTINAVFPKYLFFIFFKVTKNNFIVFNKICLLNNLIFLEQRLSTCKDSYNYTLLFYTLLFYTPYLSSRWGKFFFFHNFVMPVCFCCNWYPPTKQKLIFQADVFIFFHRFWKSFPVFRYCFKIRYVFLTLNEGVRSANSFVSLSVEAFLILLFSNTATLSDRYQL